MNNRQLVEQKLRLLSYITENKCPTKEHGLCGNVLRDDDYYDFWDDAFRSWPLFNGSLAYPIEGDSTGYGANDRKHDRGTKYGKLRLSLAKHCLGYVMNELKEVV